MATLFLIICLTVVAASERKVQKRPESLYHYNSVSKPDPNIVWNFASHLTNNGHGSVPAVDVAPPRSYFNSGGNQDAVWQLSPLPAEDVAPSRPDLNSGGNEDSPLENNENNDLYDYVGDNWMVGEEYNPYYYYTEEKYRGEQEDNKKEYKEELPSKHRRKYRRLRSLANKRKAENGLYKRFDALNEVRSARKAPQFLSNKMKRAIKLHTRNVLTNAEKVHSTSDLQIVPTIRKRDIQLKTSDLEAPAGRFQMHRLSRRNMKRRRRQVKAHQLEYFTDNDGDSQFHAPGKTEGTEWDLVPLEALKDDSEEELGIQYDKKANDASLLTSE